MHPVEFFIGLIGEIIAGIGAANKAQNAVWRNGLPFCPNCNRQISLKTARPSCRACGYNLTRAPQRPAPPPEPPSPAQLLREEARRKEREKERREREAQDQLQLERRGREAEAQRIAKLALDARKAAKRQAAIEANGGYTDLQLITFGVGIIIVPLSLVGIVMYMAIH